MKTKRALKATKVMSLISAGIAVTLTASLLTGCGKRKNNENLLPPVLVPPGLPGVIPPPGLVGGGCIPINQPIPFNGNNIYVNYANLVGGRIPMSNQQVGSVMVGGAPIGNGQLSRIGVDGTINVNITPGGAYPQPVPYPQYTQQNNPYYYGQNLNNQYNQFNQYGNQYGYGQSSQQANIQGTVTINPDRQQDILWKFSNGGNGINGQFGFNQGYQPQNGYYMYQQPGYTQPAPINPGSVCVSQISFDLGKWIPQGQSQGIIYGGRVFLYLNNTEHGYILYF